MHRRYLENTSTPPEDKLTTLATLHGRALAVNVYLWVIICESAYTFVFVLFFFVVVMFPSGGC